MSIWNPFGSSGGNPLVPQQGQGAFTGVPAPGTTTITTTGAGLLSPNQLSQLLGIFGPVNLTEQEKKELDTLSEEYKINLKSSKLSLYKKLSPDLRQFIINFFLWQEAVGTINQMFVEKPQRLVELEQKEQQNKLFGQSQQWYTHHSTIGLDAMSIPTQLPLPEGITIDDLKQAHLEATMEEEMLNGEEKT